MPPQLPGRDPATADAAPAMAETDRPTIKVGALSESVFLLLTSVEGGRAMGFKCGIVGLPNVGKSTLFNALTKSGIAAENYPFCTIDPNIGVVPLPDAPGRHRRYCQVGQNRANQHAIRGYCRTGCRRIQR
jgi:hypothetical protein